MSYFPFFFRIEEEEKTKRRREERTKKIHILALTDCYTQIYGREQGAGGGERQGEWEVMGMRHYDESWWTCFLFFSTLFLFY